MTPEHKAKMAAGRARYLAEERSAGYIKGEAEKVEGKRKAAAAVLAKALRSAERAKAALAKLNAPLGLSPAFTTFKEELEVGIGADVPNDFVGAGVGPVVADDQEAGRIAVMINHKPLSPSPTALPIDYDALAQAMIRAQAKANEEREAMKPAGGPVLPPVTRDDRGMPVQGAYDTNLVRPGNNPVTRILAQLTFPADKTAQVVAMIAANMAPSWSEFNQEITDQPHAPVGERALVAYLQEYCMQLRPELPKTYLEPMYKNHTPEAAPTVPAPVSP